MKKTFLFLSLFVGLVTTSFAQKTINDANAEKRTVGSFHGIDVATGIELTLTKGTTEEVAVSASETQFRDKIVTEVRNGILRIHYETKSGAINKKNESKRLRAYVSYKSLDLLHVSTGAEVNIDGVLEATTFELKANTGGLVKAEINIGTLTVDQNTGSKITLTGKVDKLEAEGDTGSKFMGENLVTNTCFVKMSTGAGIHISVDKELNVKADTGGYIKYKGNAGIREIKTNTGGYVSKI
ncbi:MAG TPA: head GIN domain-containing protein [Chitinophagaceae bacterium]|nr:head GIN domain-containing protein [Chitinophagaceae bacterium]